MATAGFFAQLGDEAQQKRQREQDADMQLRERRADDLENSIAAIQANPNLSPQEKTFQIGEAQKQLTSLYKPHQMADLFKRLSKKKAATGVQSATVPGAPPLTLGATTIPGNPPKTIELRPGMTLDEVLAAGAPAQPAPKIVSQPQKGADGKYYVITEDAQGNLGKKEVPFSEESELQSLIDAGLSREDAQKALQVRYKLAAPAVAKPKGFKYDAATDEVIDQDTGKRFTRNDAARGIGGETVARMFEGSAKVQKHKEDISEKRFRESIERQNNSIRAAFDRADYVAARRELNKAKGDYRQSVIRQETMHRNLQEATDNPTDQQAMMSLLANHIGMTMGAQKGARITRAVWEEALGSRPWLSGAKASFTVDKDGVEILSGVVLTPDQMRQMVELADDKVDILKNAIQGVEEDYADDLAKTHGTRAKPAAQPKQPARKVGDIVTSKGKKYRITGVRSDGKYDAEEIK